MNGLFYRKLFLSIIFFVRFDHTGSLETDVCNLMKRLVSPYFEDISFKSNQIYFTPFGTPVLNLSATASIYWLPMESRIGYNQLDQLVQRCGEPRIGLILPQEIENRNLNFVSFK